MENTCKCGAIWTGVKASHCSVCHYTFGKTQLFDDHRYGDFDERKCKNPEEMNLIEKEDIWIESCSV